MYFQNKEYCEKCNFCVSLNTIPFEIDNLHKGKVLPMNKEKTGFFNFFQYDCKDKKNCQKKVGGFAYLNCKHFKTYRGPIVKGFDVIKDKYGNCFIVDKHIILSMFKDQVEENELEEFMLVRRRAYVEYERIQLFKYDKNSLSGIIFKDIFVDLKKNRAIIDLDNNPGDLRKKYGGNWKKK